MRAAQPFPAPGVNVSQFTFPRARQSYRVVTLRATIVAAAAGGAQASLAMIDGAGNTIASWSTFRIPAAATPYTVTFADQDVDANVGAGLGSGDLINCAIPPDVWVQPQRQLQLSINPNAAGDSITNLILQTEQFADKKPVAKAQPTGQD